MPGIKPGGLENPNLEALPTQEVSSVEADEKTYENLPERKDTFLEEEGKTTEVELTKEIEGVPTSAPATPIVQKDEVTLEVEKILEKDLGEFYAQLPPEAKEKFRKKGEEAATEISGMVRSFKLKFSRALRLVRDWLLTIPGVNRFFLEQQAKLKIDLLEALVDERKEQAMNQP